MKKIILVVSAFALLAGSTVTVEARVTDDNRIEKAIKAYKLSLDSENAGVRRSALLGLAQVKSTAPSADVREVFGKLAKMSEKEDLDYIRVNAELIYIYLNNADLQEKVKLESFENADSFFKELYNAINNQYLAVR